MQIILFQTAFNVQQPLLAGTGMGLDIEKSVCRKKALLINLGKYCSHIFLSFHVWRCAHKCLSLAWGLPGGSAGKESACNAGDLDLIPGLGRSPGEGKGYPLQYSGLENIVHGVAKTQTQLSDFHFHLWTEILNRVSLIILSVFRNLESIC